MRGPGGEEKMGWGRKGEGKDKGVGERDAEGEEEGNGK